MDVGGAWMVRVSSRSLVMIIALVTALVGSVFWNLRQHGLIEQKRMAAQQEEGARTEAEAKRVAARIKKNAEWAASDARVQQLYREIENLTRINDQALSQPQRH